MPVHFQRNQDQPVTAPAIGKSGPYDLDAEQALLGALMFDNAIYERLPPELSDRQFYEPVHGRIFARIEDLIRNGELADPVLISQQMSDDVALRELGGLRYLADLIDQSPSPETARRYALRIYDLSLRRELIRFGKEVAATASTNFSVGSRNQLDAAEQQLYNLAEIGQSSEGHVSLAAALSVALEQTAEAFSHQGRRQGIESGVAEIDSRLGGLQPGDLLILAGTSHSADLTLETRIAFSVAQSYRWEKTEDGRRTISGGIVSLFTLDSTPDQVAMRLLADLSGINLDRLRRGDLTSDEFGRVRDCAIAIGEYPLFIDATSSLDISKLSRRSRQLKRSSGLDLIVIDEIVSLGGASDASTSEGLSEIVRHLLRLAHELKVAIVVSSKFVGHVIAWSDTAPQSIRAKFFDNFNIRKDSIAIAISNDPRESGTLGGPQSVGITVEQIQKEVARYFKLSVDDLNSERRSREVARPRQIAMYLAKSLTQKSYPDLGRRFGGRDHTAIIQAVRRVEDLVAQDAAVGRAVQDIRNRLVHGLADDE